MTDQERLIDSTLPLIKQLLETYSEFFPLASAIKSDDSIAQVGTYDGDKKPLSQKVILELKNGFKALKDKYKSIAIFYDVCVVDPNTELKTDAVAIFTETRNENSAYIFYYPYVLTNDNQITFLPNHWNDINNREIFVD